MVILQDLMEARGPYNTTEAMRILQQGEYCVTTGTHGIKETMVTLWGPMEPREHGTGPHTKTQQMSNSSSISHFLLLALADTRQLQLLHFCLFLGISLAALLGNGLIISAVACGHHLHTPMFFFLLNLALTDLGCICTTVPKAMHNSLWDTRNISYSGCAAQIFRAVLRIPSEQGRHKIFFTCLPHLAVVSLFLSTTIFSHLKPPSISSPSLDLSLSVLHLVVPPVLNPLIYSLRNQELKAAVWTLMTGCFQDTLNCFPVS
ncbi:olfactory receptor 14A16-like isoform X1 [Oenanthe melanoleuca]|uniref:olfactory receptor 14A16-like isoform X1 n=1 Tax=Oenanthe melanoleuca TaxID=2939378 RepID=UPI0024C0E985|nr:olfactory receptor 14A16-like isoform X1 [Oenanthe melanoleuca]